MSSLCLIISILLSIIYDVNSIDGGLRAEPGEFPYVVSIWMYGSHHCSGVIIDKTHILTAGHCVDGFRVQSLAVLPGVVDYENDRKEWFAVKSYRKHPDFESFQLEGRQTDWTRHDIAVLTLARPLTFNARIHAAVFSHERIAADEPDEGPHLINATDAMAIDDALNIARSRMDLDTDDSDSESDDYQDRCCRCEVNFRIAGWDFIEESNEKLLYLLWTDAIIYPYKICVKERKILFENELCAGDLEESTIAGAGDSGTPIMLNGEVIGIVVRGAQESHGAILTTILRTLPYLGFIDEAVVETRSVLLDLLDRP
ncbi:chymotrypsin-1 [Diachasma alloeum]|uniref:chymotrypsin-1 n=1 Tax=Diachasma alloeum TaxID=454923 RepID=UPI0007383BE5|nr:chymotrypsin-1 [Diachasma alloeum]